jgi:hypothetical protein
MGTVILRRMKPRRRRAGLTDYRKRLKLVKSGLERLVVRRTNRRIIAMLVKSKAGGMKPLSPQPPMYYQNSGGRHPSNRFPQPT